MRMCQSMKWFGGGLISNGEKPSFMVRCCDHTSTSKYWRLKPVSNENNSTSVSVRIYLHILKLEKKNPFSYELVNTFIG